MLLLSEGPSSPGSPHRIGRLVDPRTRSLGRYCLAIGNSQEQAVCQSRHPGIIGLVGLVESFSTNLKRLVQGTLVGSL